MTRLSLPGIKITNDTWSIGKVDLILKIHGSLKKNCKESIQIYLNITKAKMIHTHQGWVFFTQEELMGTLARGRSCKLTISGFVASPIFFRFHSKLWRWSPTSWSILKAPSSTHLRRRALLHEASQDHFHLRQASQRNSTNEDLSFQNSKQSIWAGQPMIWFT